MSGRRRASCGVALCFGLAGLTLVPKIVLASASRSATPQVTAASLAAVADRAGFHVVGASGGAELPGVVAQSGPCRILLVRVAPQGWNRDLVRRMAGSRPLRYLFAGGIFAEQPVLRTNLRFHWELLKRRAGLGSGMPAVLAVSWTRDCPAAPVLDVSFLRE